MNGWKMSWQKKYIWTQPWLEDCSFLKKCSFDKNGQHYNNDWWGCSQCRSFHRRHLAKHLAGDDGQAVLPEKTRHDKALEAYQAAMAKYTCEHTQLLDWIETNREIKAQADQASFCWRGRASAWIRGFSFSLNIFCLKINGCQTRQNLLQPSRLLERRLCNQKISRCGESA